MIDLIVRIICSILILILLFIDYKYMKIIFEQNKLLKHQNEILRKQNNNLFDISIDNNKILQEVLKWSK